MHSNTHKNAQQNIVRTDQKIDGCCKYNNVQALLNLIYYAVPSNPIIEIESNETMGYLMESLDSDECNDNMIIFIDLIGIQNWCK